MKTKNKWRDHKRPKKAYLYEKEVNTIIPADIAEDAIDFYEQLKKENGQARK